MDFVNIIYEIALKIIVIGWAIVIVLLILILCRILLILWKISAILKEIFSMYFMFREFVLKPFRLIKKVKKNVARDR